MIIVRQILKRLNPNLILGWASESKIFERHTVRIWLKKLHPANLRMQASLEHDIYANGYLKITIAHCEGGGILLQERERNA